MRVRYSAPAILMHWLTFVLIACGFGIALYMTELKFSPLKLKLVSWHKWIGVTVFLITLVRLTWRFVRPPPPLPPSIPSWQRHAAVGLHRVLYVLILLIPVTGWLMSSALGVPTVYLGLIELPSPIGTDKALGEQLKTVHAGLNYTLLALVCMHAAAALKHHFFDRDDVLARMFPWRSERRSP